MELQWSYKGQRHLTILGGYSQTTLFHPLPSEEEDIVIAPFPVLVFVASPNSGSYWLGPASSREIAEQVSHFFLQFSTIP